MLLLGREEPLPMLLLGLLGVLGLLALLGLLGVPGLLGLSICLSLPKLR